MSDNSRPVPSEPEAEKGITGAIVQASIAGAPRTSGQLLDELRAILPPENFTTQHGDVFRKALELHRDGKPVDQATLTSAMKGEWAPDGYWQNLIREAYLDTPHDGHAVYHAGLINKAADQRRMLYVMRQAVEDIYQGGRELAEIIAPVTAEIDAQAEHRTNGRAATSQAVVLDVIAELEADQPPGVRTGVYKLDQATGGGLKPGQMATIAARPGVGKTALMLAIASYVAEHFGQVLVVSQEMTRGELILRLLAAACGVRVDDLRGFIRNDRQRPTFIKATEDIARLPLLIDDQPGRTMADVEALARIHKRQGGISLICLDYLQLFKPDNRKASTEEQVAQISRDCKMLAKSIWCPVLVLAQLNRNVELRENRRPKLSDLRSSGAIEQDSDLVGFLDRPHMYNKQAGITEAVLILEKNRNGQTQDIPLIWNGPTMRFSNPENAGWPTADNYEPGR